MADSANGWEILNAVAQSVGAVGTTGALIVAALAYRRQVADRRSAQASRVLLRRESGGGDVFYTLLNDSDLPVTVIDFVETAPFPLQGKVTRDPEIVELLPGSIPHLWPGESQTWSFREENQPRWPAAMFYDSADRRWMRSSSHLGEIRWRTGRHPVHLYRRSRAWLSGHIGRPPES